MTISSEVSRADYISTGTVGPYAYPFKIFAATDLEVVTRDSDDVETTLVYQTDYSVSGVGDSAGGNVTLVVALTTGYVLSILRVPPIVQTTSLRNQGTFLPASYENALDYQVMISQYLIDRSDRAMTLPVSVSPDDVSVDLPTPEPGYALVWNTAGDALVNGASADGVTAPAGGRTTQSVSLYLQHNAVFNVLDFGATGNGTTDDTTAVQVAIAAAGAATTGGVSGGEVYFPLGTYLLSSTLVLPSNVTLTGVGPSSVLKVAAGLNMTIASANGVVNVHVRRLKLLGRKGTLVTNNSGVVFGAGSSYCSIEDCDVTGMSGLAVYITGAAHHCYVLRNRFYGLTADTSYNSSGAISCYQSADSCWIDDNDVDCAGVGSAYGTWFGIHLQLNSTNHIVRNNRIRNCAAYGIIDYDTTPRATNNLIEGNIIDSIDGGVAAGSGSGAGIYFAATGGAIVRYNRISNTNLSTSVFSLAPGAIGVNGAFSPITVYGNVITTPRKYGIIVTGVPTAQTMVVVKENLIVDPTDMGIYVAAQSYVAVDDNVVVCLTTTPNRGIAVSPSGGGPYTNVFVRGNTVLGAFTLNGISAEYTTAALVVGNSVTYTGAGGVVGIKVGSASGIVCSANRVVTSSSASAVPLVVNAATYSTISGNSLTANAAINNATFSGTSTGSTFDQTNMLVGIAEPITRLDNQGTGLLITQLGTKPNDSGYNSAVGDHVIQRVPVVGTAQEWFCTAAGGPGTWQAGRLLTANITGSATYNPPNLVDGDGATTTVTATGAALGNLVVVSFSLDLQGITLTGYVSAADTVSVRFQNETGGALDLASGTIAVRIL